MECSRNHRRIIPILGSALACLLFPGTLCAIEEPSYTVVESHGIFEIRQYDEVVLAETLVEADFEDAGNKAFRRLFAYISGENRIQAKIDMTAPVVQEPASAKIAMTAPVVQQSDEKGWRVAFIVPGQYRWPDAPEPLDSRVSLRLVPERTVAALRFSGTWDAKRWAAKEAELREALDGAGLEPDGPAVYARYDPPFKPWFLRRNEILIPVGAE
ncbi:MAG: heme-binding protein [Thermoanaerobaculales bacterium]|jgi:hypothetical protein|nr:heme-binding protein [Thermoanaerobaculales bacterium]